MLVGRLLQAVAPRGGEQVLEIGTGSGYVSACLARLGGQVQTTEIHPEVAELARANLQAFPPAALVRVITGDGMDLEESERYDIIVLTASLPIYDARFERALRPGGRLFVVVGAGSPQRACLVRKGADGGSASEPLFETCIEPLEGALRPAAFGF